MTVAELIEKLKALPQDLPVQFLDYEQGPTDVVTVETDYDHLRMLDLRAEKVTTVWLS